MKDASYFARLNGPIVSIFSWVLPGGITVVLREIEDNRYTHFIDPICCSFCMVLSMFLRLVLAILYIFFARHQRGTEIVAEMYSKL